MLNLNAIIKILLVVQPEHDGAKKYTGCAIKIKCFCVLWNMVVLWIWLGSLEDPSFWHGYAACATSKIFDPQSSSSTLGCTWIDIFSLNELAVFGSALLRTLHFGTVMQNQCNQYFFIISTWFSTFGYPLIDIYPSTNVALLSSFEVLQFFTVIFSHYCPFMHSQCNQWVFKYAFVI